MNLRWRTAIPVAGVAALAAGAIAVQAAPSPSPTTGQSPAQIFIDKLAGILHVTPTQAKTDLQQAELQTIDQMVKDGKLTQAQADAIKQRIQNGDGPGFGFGPMFRQPPLDRQLMTDLMNAEVQAAATTLKTTPDQLRTDLRSGKTIADLEKAAGVSDSTLRTNLVSAAKTVLDKAVKAGTITQAQEDSLLAKIQKGGFFFGGGRGMHKFGHPFGGPPPPPPGGTAPTAEQS